MTNARADNVSQRFCPAAFVGHDIYRQAEYGRLHPLTIPRVEAVVDLIRALDWFAPGEYLVSPRASIDELERRAPGGRAALWQVGRSAFGFASHPGLKTAMVEDLVMEFDESAPDVGPGLARSWSVQRELEDALVPMMTGLVQMAGWMDEAAQPR